MLFGRLVGVSVRFGCLGFGAVALGRVARMPRDGYDAPSLDHAAVLHDDFGRRDITNHVTGGTDLHGLARRHRTAHPAENRDVSSDDRNLQSGASLDTDVATGGQHLAGV